MSFPRSIFFTVYFRLICTHHQPSIKRIKCAWKLKRTQKRERETKAPETLSFLLELRWHQTPQDKWCMISQSSSLWSWSHKHARWCWQPRTHRARFWIGRVMTSWRWIIYFLSRSCLPCTLPIFCARSISGNLWPRIHEVILTITGSLIYKVEACVLLILHSK